MRTVSVLSIQIKVRLSSNALYFNTMFKMDGFQNLYIHLSLDWVIWWNHVNPFFSVTECENNTYGANCLQDCSPGCTGPSKECNSTTGECLSGCVDGYKGDKCDIGKGIMGGWRKYHQDDISHKAIIKYCY